MTDDQTFLLNVLADIRQKTGVGSKPMLSELADVLAAKIKKFETALRDIQNLPEDISSLGWSRKIAEIALKN